MGILNVTPDSFAEAAPRLDPASAVDAALRMEADGADLIDIGGESTRPGAEPVSRRRGARARAAGAARRCAAALRIPISIDTYKADVARRPSPPARRSSTTSAAFGSIPELADAVSESGAAEFAEGLEQGVGKRFVRDAEQPDCHDVER